MPHRSHHHHHRESSTEQTHSMKPRHHHHVEPLSSSDEDQISSPRRHRSRSPPPCRSSRQSQREPNFSSQTRIDSPTVSPTFDPTCPVPLTGGTQGVSTHQPLQTPFWTFLSVTLTMIFRSLIFRK